MRDPQVNAQYYKNRNYMTQVRAITHWHQASAVDKCSPENGTVLEIGPGTGHTTWLLNLWGFDVTTLDIDESLSPDIVGDVTNIQLADCSYDCVLAAEVLEHLPFESFEKSLKELSRISKRYAVITLPAPLIGLSLLANIPLLNPAGLSIGLPYLRPHKFNGEHYWELGKLGYGKRRVIKSIESAGWKIVERYRPPPSLYSYFFILEKEKKPDI